LATIPPPWKTKNGPRCHELLGGQFIASTRPLQKNNLEKQSTASYITGPSEGDNRLSIPIDDFSYRVHSDEEIQCRFQDLPGFSLSRFDFQSLCREAAAMAARFEERKREWNHEHRQ
jgi:hypothetical protein